MARKENPYVQAEQKGRNKVYSWLCFGQKPAVLTVNGGNDNEPEINIDVKSLFAALKANGYKVTKIKE